MTVTFINDDSNICVPNNLIVSSDMINDMIAMCNTIDVYIKVKDKYKHIFNIYLNFLYNKKQRIKHVNVLVECFDMESFFIDMKFFMYLIQQAYGVWTEFLPVIQQLPDTRTIYLHTPYEFIPDSYTSNPAFFNAWLKINANSTITINNHHGYSNDVYYFDKDKQHVSLLVTYHIVKWERVGLSHKRIWYPGTGQLKQQFHYKDKKQDGVQREWYDNTNQDHTFGQLKHQFYCKDDKKDGIYQSWYANGQLCCYGEYKDKHLDGMYQTWHDNGQLKYQAYYEKGRPVGLCESWYVDNVDNNNNGQLKSRRNYKDGNCHGIQQTWYANGQLEKQNYYELGEWVGLWEEWYEDGQLKYQRNYTDSRQHGENRAWHADGHMHQHDLYDMGKFVRCLLTTNVE